MVAVIRHYSRSERLIMGECFIIMPISTPENLVPAYNGDKDHFLHVLDHLFVPALEKLNLDPIRPIAEGSDLIHAEIIKNLERADLVLCDASALNANVFFELGIRTALDKPVCIVRDELTPKIPFDMSIINHAVYRSEISIWTLKNQIDELAAHIKSSMERSSGRNMIWKYFGLTTRGSLPPAKDGVNERLELLTMQVEGLSKKLDQPSLAVSEGQATIKVVDPIFSTLTREAFKYGIMYTHGSGSKLSFTKRNTNWNSRRQILAHNRVDSFTKHGGVILTFILTLIGKMPHLLKNIWNRWAL